MHNLAILSNKNNPFLPLYFLNLKKKKIKNLFFFLEEKTISKKDKQIIFSRLNKKTKTFLNKKKYKFIKKNINTFYFKSFNNLKSFNFLKKKKIKYFLNAGVMEKLDKNMVKFKIINVHPGILPYYRGCSCPEWALYNNDDVGITAHFMNKNYDAGRIIKIKKINKKIKNYKDFRTNLYNESIKMGVDLLSALTTRKKLGVFKKQNSKKAKYYPPIPQNLFNKVLKKFEK